MRAHRRRFAASILVPLSAAGASSRAPPARAHCEAYPPDEKRALRGLDPGDLLPPVAPEPTDPRSSEASPPDVTWWWRVGRLRCLDVLYIPAPGRCPPDLENRVVAALSEAVRGPAGDVAAAAAVALGRIAKSAAVEALLSVRAPNGVGTFFCAEGTPY